MKYILIFIIVIFSSFNFDPITGRATYYSNSFEGRKTASGEIFRQGKLTAASNYFKLGSTVKVTNTSNGKEVIVTINDRTARSTAKRGIVVDLTTTAAKEIGIYKHGSARVTVEQV